MVGGYVSVDNLINTVVEYNKPTYVKGSFELAKSLVNIKKPIIGVMTKPVENVLHVTNVVATYIGLAHVESDSLVYISVFCFGDPGAVSVNAYTITNEDIVTLSTNQP